MSDYTLPLPLGSNPLLLGIENSNEGESEGAWSSGLVPGFGRSSVEVHILFIVLSLGLSRRFLYCPAFADAPEMKGWFCSLYFSIVLPCVCSGDIRLILRFTHLYCPIFRTSYYKLHSVYHTRRWPQRRSSCPGPVLHDPSSTLRRHPFYITM